MLAQHLLVVADRFMLLGRLGESAAAEYSLSYLPATAVTVGCVAVTKALSPQLCGLLPRLGSGESATVERDIHAVCQSWFEVLVLGAAAAVVLCPLAVELTTPAGYAQHPGVAAWLAAATGLHGLYMLLSVPLFMEGRTLLLALASASAAMVNLILNFVLIDSWGIHGSASATLAAYLSLVVTVAIMQSRCTTPLSIRVLLSVWPRLWPVVLIGSIMWVVNARLPAGLANAIGFVSALFLVWLAFRRLRPA